MALSLKKRDLSKYDTEVGLDTSGSMDAKDTPTGLSRLDDSKKTIGLLIKEAGELDDDGITVWCFDTDIHDVNENTTDAKAQKVLAAARATGGGTYHAKALKPRVDEYLDQLLGKAAVPGKKGGFFGGGTKDIPAVPANPNTKPRLYVVITDGCPSNTSEGERELENLIIDATKRLAAAGYGRDKIGFSFIQTGKDKQASAFLERLNNGLVAKGAKFDCVNCLTVDECVGLTTKQILEKALDD
jgi:hypothetical protein